MAARAGLYMRVSDDHDARSRSVVQQGDQLRAVCAERGWRVVTEYPEPDRSASRFARKERPQWERLTADLRAGRLDVVVLWEPSRGDRRLTGWSAFLDDCRDRGVLVHVESHHRTYDLANPRDWKSLAEDGVDSAWESEKTSMRIRRDMADAAEKGLPHGRLAYGYRRRYDPVTRALLAQEPDPETAPVVREITTRIAQSEAVSAIVADLERRGIPSPTGRARWSRGTVCRMVLEGVVYIGKRRYNGGPLLDGNWPPLVDEDVYWAAVTVLRDPARKPKGAGIRPGRARWLLSYVASCAECGGPLSVKHLPRAGSRQHPPFYRCVRKGCVSAPVAWLDFLVTEAVIKFCSDPLIYETITAGDDAAAQAARDEAAAERARLAVFEAQAVAGQISPASFARIAAGIEARAAALDARAEALSAPPALRALLDGARHGVGGEAGRAADIRDRWAGMPVTAQRRVVQTLYAPTLAPVGDGPADSPWRVDMHRKYDRLPTPAEEW